MGSGADGVHVLDCGLEDGSGAVGIGGFERAAEVVADIAISVGFPIRCASSIASSANGRQRSRSASTYDKPARR